MNSNALWRAIFITLSIYGVPLSFLTGRFPHYRIQASHLQTTQPDAVRGLNRCRNTWNRPGSICHNPSKSARGVRDALGTF